MKTWFADQAHQAGWAGVYFLPEVQSNHGAGCILWRTPQTVNLHVVVTEQTLVFHNQVDVGEEEEDDFGTVLTE